MITRSVAELLGAATTILALGTIFQTCLIDSTSVTVFPVLDMYVCIHKTWFNIHLS